MRCAAVRHIPFFPDCNRHFFPVSVGNRKALCLISGDRCCIIGNRIFGHGILDRGLHAGCRIIILRNVCKCIFPLVIVRQKLARYDLSCFFISQPDHDLIRAFIALIVFIIPYLFNMDIDRFNLILGIQDGETSLHVAGDRAMVSFRHCFFFDSVADHFAGCIINSKVCEFEFNSRLTLRNVLFVGGISFAVFHQINSDGII